MRQRILFLLSVAIISAGCQKKASGQTVAVVNGEEITAAELNDALSKNAPQGANTKEARAAVLQQLVDRKLLVQQAKKDGLDKSPEFINQQRRGTEDLLINMLLSRKVNTTDVPTPAQISQFEGSHPGMFGRREAWTLSQIVYPLPVSADVTAKLKAAQTLDQIADALTAAKVQFQRSTRQIDTAVLPPNIYTQLSNLKPNEAFIVPGPDKAVASVITERQPNPLTPDQTRQVAIAAMKREQVNSFLQDRVKSLKTGAKIEYQPGFEPPKK
jgi:EpsD family peptidyl-prolyl cis-trans isomerase